MRGKLIGVGVLIVLSAACAATPGSQKPPQQQIDVVDIKANLLSIGQAERVYLTAHGSYGTIEQLQQDGPASLGVENRGYVFSATTNGAQSFIVTATPTDPNKAGWPTLVITEAMQVSER
jgi:hypothetical protein